MEPREQSTEGFTLIELLVVVLIVGILAAIAMPVLLDQRTKAWENAVVSDIRNAALIMEDVFTDTASYPAPGSVPGLTASDQVVVVIEYSSSVGFCVEGTHPGVDDDADGSPDVWRFDSRVLRASAGVVRGPCPP